MKPAWDQLAEEFKDSPNVAIYDVDCTAKGEKLCSKVGVDGYPTIKYYLADSPKGKDYQGGRDAKALKKFVETTFKAGCDVKTKESCNENQIKMIDSLAGKSADDIQKYADDLTDKFNKKRDERLKYIEEGKKKIKAMKAEEEELQISKSLAEKIAKASGGGKDEL
jgi:hypothetical protein